MEYVIFSGLLTFAAGLLVREATKIFATDPPGPWIQALTIALPAAMAVATLADSPMLALAFELAAALGLWRFLAKRLGSVAHRRHPGPLHATALRAFFLLMAIVALRWSGFTGLRTGLTPFGAVRLSLSLMALMVSFLIDVCVDVGWLGEQANAVSAPIRMLVLPGLRMRVPGIDPMLPESHVFASWLPIRLRP